MQNRSSWFRFLLPIVLLFPAVLVMHGKLISLQYNHDVLFNLPYVLFVVSIALAQIFKQSRMAMIASAQLAAYWTIQTRLQVPLNEGTTLLELSLLSILFPVAAILTNVFKNTSVMAKGFLFYLAILALFMVWADMIVEHVMAGGFTDLRQGILLSIPEMSRLPVILVLFLCAMVCVTAIIALKRENLDDYVVYHAILLVSVTFIFFHVQYISSVLFSVSGILLISSLVIAGQEMAFNDRLTNLPGRRALEIDLKHLGRSFSIAMLDVDHFKKFNDTYGHDTGDDVLKLVASRLAQVKGRAKAYRYGGEEFTIIFKGKDAQSAYQYLDDLRDDIANYEMFLRDNESRPNSSAMGSVKRRKNKSSQSVNVTISIGVCDSENTKNPQEVLKTADEALYQAKQKGRNCVSVKAAFA